MPRYTIKQFQELCLKNGYMPPIEVMQMETKAILQGLDYIDVPESALDEMRQKKAEHDKWESTYQEISALRTKGMQAENDGDIEAAIALYGTCIEKGEQSNPPMFHAYSYAYDRIIILLHKTKDFDSEMNYIRSLLKHDSLSEATVNKYRNRLNKLIPNK